MGTINTDSMTITGHLGELIGYKAGLALTREELADHLDDRTIIKDIVLATENRRVRVRSEEYEAAVNWLLYNVGNLPTPSPMPPAFAVYRRFGHYPAYMEILKEVIDRCLEVIQDQIRNFPKGQPPDTHRVLEIAYAEFGRSGVRHRHSSD